MKLIEDTPTRLVFTLGIPWLNGTRCEIDKATGAANIQTANLFWRSKRTVRISDIAAVDLRVMSGPSQPGKPTTTAACPHLRLSSGKDFSLPSFGYKSGEDAVAKLRSFLDA